MFKLLLILVVISKSYEKDIIVRTKDGLIKGRTVEFNNREINIFSSIRYAQPPVGPLRFKKPVPAGKWTGIQDSRNESKICLQQTGLKYRRELSEDCLFLSIWSSSLDNKSPKAVILWIFGGGWVFGAGMDLKDGLTLASLDVVVVSCNFRVGVMGLLCSGTDEAPGNVMLYDQVLVMKWIQENIHSFGGDPSMVTIFGISSGGMSVGLHVVSPLTNGLFKRAIMMSGSPYNYDESFVDPEHEIERAKKFSKHMKCPVDESNEWLNCLRKVNAKEIQKSIEFNKFNKPIFGDEFFPETTAKMVNKGNFNSDIDFMSGVCANESAFMGNLLFRTSKSRFRKILPFLLIGDKFNYEKIFQYYAAHLKEYDYEGIRKAYGQIQSDYMFICPTYLMTKDASVWMKNNTFFYILNYKGTSRYAKVCTEKQGVCHAEDMPFITGMPIVDQKNYMQDEIQFNWLFAYLWTNFVKTGFVFNENYFTFNSY